MSDSNSPATTVLDITPKPDGIDFTATMRQVKKHYGKGILRQLIDIARLRYGPGQVHPAEYFRLGIYLPRLSWADKKLFLGREGNRRLCDRLSPAQLPNLDGLLSNKILAGRLFTSIGLPTPAEKAVFPGHPGLDAGTNLPDQAAVESFLGDPNNLPLQGKPARGSRALGQVSILGPGDTPGTLRLPFGQQVEIAALAADICRNFEDGYLFQALHRPVPALAERIGDNATIRVVTIATSAGIKTLFAIMKSKLVDETGKEIPGKSVSVLLDRETGVPENSAFVSPDLIEGLVLPDCARMHDLAEAAHAALAQPGMIGWDVIPTETGPIFLEANTRAFNEYYQLVTGRGLMHPEFRALYDDAQALSRQRIREQRALRRMKVRNPLQRYL
jgi:hypothetical protein